MKSVLAVLMLGTSIATVGVHMAWLQVLRMDDIKRLEERLEEADERIDLLEDMHGIGPAGEKETEDQPIGDG